MLRVGPVPLPPPQPFSSARPMATPIIKPQTSTILERSTKLSPEVIYYQRVVLLPTFRGPTIRIDDKEYLFRSNTQLFNSTRADENKNKNDEH
jgi:hypothetical protein